MRNVIVVAILVFCAPGIVMAQNSALPYVPPSRISTLPAAYHPHVSPDVAALQAQERGALARGDELGARELEAQVQAILIRQQHVAPHPASAMNAHLQRHDGTENLPDQLIFTGAVTALSADWEMDGTMWAAFAAAADSTIWLYKSTDHGTSWASKAQLWWGPKHIIHKIELVVGPGDSGFAYVFENVDDNNGDLKMARVGKDGSGLKSWDVLAGPDSITDFTTCRDYSGNNYWLYAIAHNGLEFRPAARSLFLRSTDFGKTWAITDTYANMNQPRMAFGAGSYGYASGVPDQVNYWPGYFVGAVTTLWSSPGTWHFHPVRPDSFRINDMAIAPAFTLPPESATVWIAYSHNVLATYDYDVLSSYARGDTFLAWQGTNTIANSKDPEGYVDLRNYPSAGNGNVDVSYIDDDPTNHYNNAWLGYSSSSAPGTWTPLSSPWVNQSGYVGFSLDAFPRIIYSPPGGSSGGLVFAGYNPSTGNTNGYFNAPWFGAIAESPAPAGRPVATFSAVPSISRGPVRISWDGSAARLTVADVTGRVVRSVAAPAGNLFVWDDRVPAGTYLISLTTNRGRTTRPVVIR